MKNNPNEEVEVIQTTEHGEEVYYLKPSSQQYQFYRSKMIPRWLFEMYVERRELLNDTRKRLRRYFKPVKDKPMTVAKNHVLKEGEIVKFD